MNNEFKSIEDLYNRVLPALKIKKKFLKKRGLNEDETMIFRFLIKSKWSISSNLSLNIIVNDILNYKNVF